MYLSRLDGRVGSEPSLRTTLRAYLAAGGPIEAAADGDALAWHAIGPVVSEPQGNRALEPTQLLSTRGATGWETQSLETPHERGSSTFTPVTSEYLGN